MGWKTAPRLQADVGRIRLGQMPEAENREIRGHECYATMTLGAFQCYLTGNAFQDDGVLVKHMVRQWKLIAFHREGQFPSGDEACWGKFHPPGLAGRNLYHIVLKAQPFLQRNIDSGVSPKTKVHGFFVFIFHGNLHMQRGIFQTVTDGIAEQERILLIERRTAFQHEGYGSIRLLCNGELRRR